MTARCICVGRGSIAGEWPGDRADCLACYPNGYQEGAELGKLTTELDALRAELRAKRDGRALADRVTRSAR